jgi:hypothetical protein
MKRILSQVSAISVLLFLFAFSCSEGSCFEETESYVKATLYSGPGKAEAPEKLSLRGIDRDSLIYENSSGVKVALIPLNSSTETCSFLVTINEVSDVVTFHYTSFPHLISKECGYTFYHHLESDPVYTKNVIDTITVSSPDITNLNAENIRIYY